MTLKNRKKIYISFNEDLLSFLDNEAKKNSISRTKYINNILYKELEKVKKKEIERIIEGK
jgi:metal-responsive CopG/Arc/MetJ family transcriptional regulator